MVQNSKSNQIETDISMKKLTEKKRTERLSEISKIILGANIGFLPFLMFYLVAEGKTETTVSIVLWFLTTWVLISEWWSLSDTLERYPSDSKRILALSVLYLVTLIFLPVSLLIGQAQEINLASYVMVFLVLSIIDIPISFLYHRQVTDKEAKNEFRSYMYFDGALLLIYGLFLFFVIPYDMALTYKAMLLAGCFFVEFMADHFLVSE